MRVINLFLFIAVMLIIGCGITDTEGDISNDGTPTQFYIDERPEIQLAHNPDSPYIVVQEPALRFGVTARDSTPHLNWLPTKLQVETDQGYKEDLLLKPFACIVPIEESPEDFPFNVEWWSCSEVNVNNAEVLTEEHIQEIENVANARLSVKLLFKTMPGGQYIFDLNEVGRPAIQEAIEKIRQLSYIRPVEGEDEEWNVSHAPQYPKCWLSDAVPPPPCPPWYLFKRIRISLNGEKVNHIPVQEGGWVKATYTMPDGTTKSTTFTIPEID